MPRTSRHHSKVAQHPPADVDDLEHGHAAFDAPDALGPGNNGSRRDGAGAQPHPSGDRARGSRDLASTAASLLLEHLDDPHAAAMDVVALLLRELGCPVGRVWIAEEGAPSIDATVAATAVLQEVLGGDEPAPRRPLVEIAWSRKVPAWSEGLDGGSIDRPRAATTDAGSIVAVPIVAVDVTLGAIELYLPGLRPLPLEQFDALAAIGLDLGRVFAAARARVELLRRSRLEFERALHDYQKLVRHRLLNPLAIISGSAMTIDEQCELAPPGPLLLQQIITAAARIEHLSFDPAPLDDIERALDAFPHVDLPS